MLIYLVLLLCICCENVVVGFDCKDNYFGIDALNLCPNNCIECSLYDSCILCSRNNSGSFCRAKCTTGCTIVFIPNNTLLRGCNIEKKGDSCCMTCPPYSLCTSCLKSNGSCLKCNSGFFGSFCDKPCGHCTPGGEGVVKCDIYTGDCENECIDAYFGQRCDKLCNDNCLDLKTNKTKCDKQSGDCTYGCVPERYGDTCESICSNNCLGNICNQLSGNCTFGCVQGWYGYKCGKNCSKTCAHSFCDQATGKCTNGCVPGQFGYMCEETCSNKCNNNICAQTTGHCESGCLPGWYGDTCNTACGSTCSSSDCNQLSGYCNNGCSAGWHGSKCEESCSSSCLNKTCNQTSGFCQNGCTHGSYGNMCEMRCNSTCSDNACNHISGDCMFGCVSGSYGNSCGESCSETCFNRSCDQFTGLCDKGCVLGYYGGNCEKNCNYAELFQICDNSTVQCQHRCKTGDIESVRNKGSATDQISTLRVITYSLVGVVSAIMFPLVICFIRRIVFDRRNNLPDDRTITTKSTTEPIYEEIDDLNDSYDSKICEKDTIHDSRTNSNRRRNDDCLVARTEMVTAESVCRTSETNRSGNFCSSRGCYEIPVSGATMKYGRMGIVRNDITQPRSHLDTLGCSNALRMKDECTVMKSNHSITSNTEETEYDFTYNGLYERKSDESLSSETPVKIVNRESALYLHPLS